MQYPEKPFEHRDAVLGISFPLAAIDCYPTACGQPSLALQKLRPILKRLHDSLKVGRLSAGEDRAIEAACHGAADNGAIYDTTEPKEEQLRGWRVMWFVSEYAFGDAYVLAETWRDKALPLWKEAKAIIDRVTRTMYTHHPAEEEEACRIWCCHASPYRKSQAGGHMAELNEITALRQIRLDIQRHRKAIAELEKKMDELLEVGSTTRPSRRKTISASDAAALIREGKLRERLST